MTDIARQKLSPQDQLQGFVNFQSRNLFSTVKETLIWRRQTLSKYILYELIPYNFTVLNKRLEANH
jgi:hypothetical protein